MHTVRCPNCGTVISIEQNKAEQATVCNGCGWKITVPRSPAMPPGRSTSPPIRNAAQSTPPPRDKPGSGSPSSEDAIAYNAGQDSTFLLVGGIAAAIAITIIATCLAVFFVDNGGKEVRKTATPDIETPEEPPAPAVPSETSTSTLLSHQNRENQAPNAHTTQQPRNLEELVAQIEPSVVRIDAESADGAWLGSGLVVGHGGTVATNSHVIEGATRSFIEFRDGQRFPVVGVTHFDITKDIALIRADLKDYAPRPLTLATHSPRKGAKVVAFGSPKGFSFSVSEGIIAGMRSGTELSEVFSSTGMKVTRHGTWIQTTAPVSPGNSGGPLVDMQGRVIGLNTIASVGPRQQNINFAISAEDIRLAVDNSHNVQPISLAELEEARQRALASSRADIDENKVIAAALIDERISPVMTEDLHDRLSARRVTVIDSADEARWGVFAFYNGSIFSGTQSCKVYLCLVKKDVARDGQLVRRIVWDAVFSCSGASLAKDHELKMNEAIADLLTDFDDLRR